jgi:hypothetical protein
MIIELSQDNILVRAGQRLCLLHQVDHRYRFEHIYPALLDALRERRVQIVFREPILEMFVNGS